jgi:hypothetical protein
MPAYLVELPENEPGHTLFEGANKMVVFAADAANAIDAAQGHYAYPAGADAMWGGATATEIVAGAGADLEDYEFSIVVQNASPVIDYTASGNGIAMASGVVNAAGSGYTLNDILTVVGGTFTRAATLRATGVTTGAIDTVEVVDPGEYTVAPTLTANAVTGGTGTAATIDLTQAHVYGYEVFMAQMVGLLNGDAQIAGSLVDMSEGGAGARIFQVSSIGDGLGDLILVPEFRKNGAPVAGLLSTVVDEGIAGAVLTVAIPASPLPIPSVTPVKGV